MLPPALSGRGGLTGKVDSKLESLYFGDTQIMTWYSSPYPAVSSSGAMRGSPFNLSHNLQEYLQQDRIWICEFCLQYFKTEALLARHMVGEGEGYVL